MVYESEINQYFKYQKKHAEKVQDIVNDAFKLRYVNEDRWQEVKRKLESGFDLEDLLI